MGKHRKDFILLILCLVFMAGCSSLVEDPRLAMPPKKPVVEKAAKKVISRIETAQFLTNKDYFQEVINTADEAPEEVTTESDEVVSQDENDQVTEGKDETQYEDYYEPGLIYLGTYEITAYEYTGSTCANGNYPTPWYTVASNNFDFGTTLYIDGVGYVVCEDRGAGWHGDNWLDLYIGDIDACYEWGRQYRDVYLVE